VIDRLPDAWAAWYVAWLVTGGTALATAIAVAVAILRIRPQPRYARRALALLTALGLLGLGIAVGMTSRATRQLAFASELGVDLRTDRYVEGFPASHIATHLAPGVTTRAQVHALTRSADRAFVCGPDAEKYFFMTDEYETAQILDVWYTPDGVVHWVGGGPSGDQLPLRDCAG
jgi:hypothetical protein